MGKALLLLVLGSGIVLAKQLYSNQMTERESRLDQTGYEEEVLAREIARSAFNTAMGIAREHPNALDAAVTSIHGADGTVDTMYAGTAQGGHFRVRAVAETGHSLRITATGYFGGEFRNGQYVKQGANGQWVPAASFQMSDNYRIRVLEVREEGELTVNFLESMAGWCSSVFMQEFRNDQLVATRMIYTSGRNRDGARPVARFWVAAGTQLNFFIGVDKDCSEQRSSSATTCDNRTYVLNHTFNPAHYRPDGTRISTSSFSSTHGLWDHIHHALEVPVGSMERAQEATWGLIEQHPANRQRWRIGWEDQHLWNNAASNTPRNSLQATKRQGYDTNGDGRGEGWAARNAMGYRQLRDFGSYPDFSDQVIEVSITPITTVAQRQELRDAMLAERTACNITTTAYLPPPPPAPPEPPTGEPGGGGGETGTTPPDGGSTTTSNSSSSFGCPCSTQHLNSGKIGILHRPPGNPGNSQTLCISANGWNGHRNHDDLILCRGS